MSLPDPQYPHRRKSSGRRVEDRQAATVRYMAYITAAIPLVVKVLDLLLPRRT